MFSPGEITNVLLVLVIIVAEVIDNKAHSSAKSTKLSPFAVENCF